MCRKYGTPKKAQQATPAYQYSQPQYQQAQQPAPAQPQPYQPPTVYHAPQSSVQTAPQPAQQAQQPAPAQPQPYQPPTVYQGPPQQQAPQVQIKPETEPYQPPATQYPQKGYGQQAYPGSYDSYSSEPASRPPQVVTSPSSKPVQPKCNECGMPLPPSGECPQCKAKEVLQIAEQMMGVATGSGVETSKVERLVREAKNSLEEGNFGEARTTAEKAQSLIEQLEDEHGKAQSQVSEAERVIASVKKKNTDTAQADSLIQLANSFLKTGNYEKAVAYSRKAIKTANEAETRQASNKAKEERPAMPPAVARPIDTEEEPDLAHRPKPPVVEPKSAVRPPAAAVPPAQAGTPTNCPQCGEEVEPGWKRCPSCTAPLVIATPPAAKEIEKSAPKDKQKEPSTEKPRVPETETAGPPRDPEYVAAEKEIRKVETELEELEKKGENMAHAKNLLKLAVSFLKGGSYEKATRYARKVQNVIDEKKED